MPQEKKSVLASKTIWVGLLTLAGGIISLVAGSELIVEYPAVVSVLAMVSGTLAVILRTLTTQGVK